jgi:hypothetical protein
MDPQAADSWEDLLSDEEDKKEKAAAAAAADAKAKAAAAGAAEDEESSSEEDDGEDDETSEDEGMESLGFWVVTWVYVFWELGCTRLGNVCVGSSSSSKRIERVTVKRTMGMMRPAKMKVRNPWGVNRTQLYCAGMNCVGTGGARVGSVC